ncbi:MAG: ATP-grasp domain-containing protein [Planctomycetes bacterium]|nr:ATP-grasp domain-containing protein [Planctomycetota bacterium]
MLREFQRAMQDLDIAGQVLASDICRTSAAMQAADAGIVVPRVANEAYLPALLDAVEQHDVGLLVPLTDLDLLLLAKAREAFARRGCTVMVSSPEAVACCRDKLRFDDVVAAAGLATGRCVTLAEFRDAPFYPCFAKPIDGSAGIGASRIDNEPALDAHVARFGSDLVIQDCHDGQEYTIDVYRTRAGEIKTIVPRQRLVVRSGEVEQGLTVRDEALMAATRQLVDSVDGLWGVMCCQCRRDPGGEPYFFELNPRFGGGAPLSIAAGADLPRYLLQDVLGRDIGRSVGDFEENVLMLRYLAAICVDIDNPASLRGFDATIFK